MTNTMAQFRSQKPSKRKYKRKEIRYRYHGSLGKYATLERIMEGRKTVMVKKGEHGYYDLYYPSTASKRRTKRYLK